MPNCHVPDVEQNMDFVIVTQYVVPGMFAYYVFRCYKILRT